MLSCARTRSTVNWRAGDHVSCPTERTLHISLPGKAHLSALYGLLNREPAGNDHVGRPCIYLPRRCSDFSGRASMSYSYLEEDPMKLSAKRLPYTSSIGTHTLSHWNLFRSQTPCNTTYKASIFGIAATASLLILTSAFATNLFDPKTPLHSALAG